MRYKNFLHWSFYVVVLSFVFQACLKDNISPEINFNFDDSSLLLKYIEENGDYINSNKMPSIVNVDEVHSNLGNYLILDIRTSAEYIAGHIPGAINLAPDSLISYYETKDNINSYLKIVIVSASGQASSYYTCLLRLYGINNVYSLNFGMAQWNSAFSDVWVNKLVDNYFLTASFDNIVYPKGTESHLPDIQFNFPDSSVQLNANARISDLIKKGFNESDEYLIFNKFGGLPFSDEDYIICYGTNVLYLQGRLNTTGSGHYPGTVEYVPWYDLRSTANLQTLPPNQRIDVYSTSGQQSAFVVAYLRLLGYDAKTLLFGASDLFYSNLQGENQWLAPFVFFQSDIRNYSYVTGPSPN